MTSGLAEAFETTFKTFDALVNNEKETTTNINHQFEELRSSIENIQRDITLSRPKSTGEPHRRNALPLETIKTLTNSSIAALTSSFPKLHVTIRMNGSEKGKSLSRQGPQATVKAINTAIEDTSRTITLLQGIKIKAARNLRSGDTKAFIHDRRQFEILKERSTAWTTLLELRARLSIELFKIVIHRVTSKSIGGNIHFDETSANQIHNIVKDQNREAFENGDRICSVAWLKQPTNEVSALVVGLDKPLQQTTLSNITPELQRVSHARTYGKQQIYHMVPLAELSAQKEPMPLQLHNPVHTITF
ncbi:hypothetical protein H2198_007589 [Neophaeococcomyces mojaviensis]|uniref:Uncharacterized protein n=1 Tax=Neophaeococcomyces mojaviensis TaxID=3383035 RepID=A0ACC2ZZS4_9EURO|nr:hypothetical protein H2198_007589 [Knufia sp. JES_112]